MKIKLILDIECDAEEAAQYCGSDKPDGRANKKDVVAYISQSINSGGIGKVDVYMTRCVNRKYIPIGEPM